MKLKSTEDLAVGDIKEELLIKQELPIGRAKFFEWSDRIIEASLVQADQESLRFSLAAMLMHLGPTEAFKEDGFFILQLRKAAVNQTAHSLMTEMKENQEKNQEKKLAEDTAPKNKGVVNGVLENQTV